MFCYENQSLIIPLLKLRDKFRNKLIGRSFWEDMTCFRNEDDNLNRYDYIFVVRDELVRIAIECTMKEEKEQRRMEMIANRNSRIREDKRSFIQKHFGMHRKQIDHASDKAHGSNKSMRYEGKTDWDLKVKNTKKNKYAVKNRLDKVKETKQKPSAPGSRRM